MQEITTPIRITNEDMLKHNLNVRQRINKTRLLLYTIFIDDYKNKEQIKPEYKNEDKVIKLLEKLGCVVYFNENTCSVSFNKNGGYTCSLFILYKDYIKDFYKLQDLIIFSEIII